MSQSFAISSWRCLIALSFLLSAEVYLHLQVDKLSVVVEVVDNDTLLGLPLSDKLSELSSLE